MLCCPPGLNNRHEAYINLITSLQTCHINELTELHVNGFYFADCLTDKHVLELSKRVTSSLELEDLGIKGLRLPEHVIRTALHNHRTDIKSVAMLCCLHGVINRQTGMRHIPASSPHYIRVR